LSLSEKWLPRQLHFRLFGRSCRLIVASYYEQIRSGPRLQNSGKFCGHGASNFCFLWVAVLHKATAGSKL
jgi:hypothetical protein